MTPERELAEIKSKVEEFRKWIQCDVFTDLIPTHEVVIKFAKLIPPPKKGCWGFFRDYRKEPYRKESELTGRMFESCEDEDHANRVRDCFDSMNPGPVFFLEEK